MVDYSRFDFDAHRLSNGPGEWFSSAEDRTPANWQQAPVQEKNKFPDFAQEIHRLPEGRRQLIFRIRRQIAEGTYETEQKLELAVDRLSGALLGRDDSSLSF